MSTESDVAVYVALADHHDRTGEVALRDRYLVLAADAALAAGHPLEAERLRQRLLRHSRSHLLAPYPSFVHAQGTKDVQMLLTELRRSCPPAEARRLLDALRRGRPGRAPAGPRRPDAFPPTATDLGVDLDSTWLPEADVTRAPDVLERTGDIDVTAALGDLAPPPREQRAEPPPRPPASPRPRPAPAPRPVPAPAARPLLPRGAPPPAPPPPAPAPPSSPEPDQAQPGAWVATLLAVVVVVVGLALAGCTLVNPFLPR